RSSRGSSRALLSKSRLALDILTILTSPRDVEDPPRRRRRRGPSVRGGGHVQAAVALRLRQTRLVLDVVEVLVAELLDAGDDRADGGVAEGAEGLAADVVGHVEEEVGVLLAAFAALEAEEDGLHPVRPLAAGRAL